MGKPTMALTHNCDYDYRLWRPFESFSGKKKGKPGETPGKHRENTGGNTGETPGETPGKPGSASGTTMTCLRKTDYDYRLWPILAIVALPGLLTGGNPKLVMIRPGPAFVQTAAAHNRRLTQHTSTHAARDANRAHR